MSKPIHILLIEDDEEDYLITQDIVEDIPHGRYKLEWVSNFEEGIEAVEKGVHDVYLIDYRLGREDGLELLKRVDAANIESPFILLTGQNDIELEKEALLLGASDFLVKGDFSAGILARTIRYAIDQKKTLLKLQRSKKQLKAAQKLANIGHFDWDLKTEKVYWSDEMYRIYGYEPQSFEVTVDFVLNNIHSEDRPKFQNLIKEVKEKQKAISFGYRIIRPDKSIRYVKGNREMIFDNRGKAIQLFGTIRDVTKEKAYETAIEKEKETAQMYLDIAGSMMVVINQSEEITLLNQRGEEILGVKEQEVLGKNWFDLFIPPTEREQVRTVFDNLMEKKGQNVEYFENSVITKGGGKKLIWWHNRVLIDSKGAVQGTISSGVDITELRGTELQLQASEAKAKILFDYSSIVIWEEDFSEVKRSFTKLRKKGITDFRTYFSNNLEEVKRLASLIKIKQVNQETFKFYGVQSKEELMTKLADWFVDTSWTVFTEELIALAEGKSEFEGEITVTTPSGELKHLFMRLSVPPQYLDSFESVLVSFIDISELKASRQKIEEYSLQLEQKVIDRTKELRASEQKLKVALSKEKELGQLKSRFVSMASHEFRTPLSSILSSAELLGMYLESGRHEKCGRNINRIKNSVRNLTGILNDFLSLEKLEAGKVDVQNTSINLAEYLDELTEEIKPILRPEQQLLFETNQLDTIETDPYLLKNILINLISNAIKYSPNGKDVTLSISKEKEQLLFKVIDRGIGIPNEDKQHMFSRFFRASNVENIKGTGLGLTIVKRYLDLMGGTIDFESEYGKGSTFFFHLPNKY